MEENRLFNEIKSAVENAESKKFPGMEKVWHRVEEKLENKEDKKAAWRWKRIAVAASVLLFGTLGHQLFWNNTTHIRSNETITSKDSIRNIPMKDVVATKEAEHPDIKKDADKILQKQISPEHQIALEEKIKSDEPSGISTQLQTTLPATVTILTENSTENDLGEEKESNDSDVEMFLNRNGKVSNAQKEEPLIVINDKVSRKDIKEHEFTEADSLVVLKEPLYIINGVEYTEQEVFGPNPTSPYTPLNKQEIETLSILQNEKAIEIYGKKGKKGVVIITTKNGKPISVSKKAK